MSTSNWSTMKHRTRGPKNITIASTDDELNLWLIHNAGPPVTGTTLGPSLQVQTGPDGHALYDWTWPDDAAYVAEAERYARRRQTFKAWR